MRVKRNILHQWRVLVQLCPSKHGPLGSHEYTIELPQGLFCVIIEFLCLDKREMPRPTTVKSKKSQCVNSDHNFGRFSKCLLPHLYKTISVGRWINFDSNFWCLKNNVAYPFLHTGPHVHTNCSFKFYHQFFLLIYYQVIPLSSITIFPFTYTDRSFL